MVPQSDVSQHRGTFGGVGMRYWATVGETVLKSKAGVPEAAVVTTAYVREPRDRSRPVTFLFNGGAGLGLGRASGGGVRRDDGAPPYPLLDNPDSLLDVTDLVLIDPSGTGFSVLLPGAKTIMGFSRMRGRWPR